MGKSTARSRHLASMRPAFLWAFLPSLALLLISPPAGDAQEVTTSITSTTGAGNLGTTVSQAGNLYTITGGTRPGGVTGTNLFHSFGAFSVGQGDIGNFFNDTGLPTSNILGRVTGGNVSNIYGTIQTTDFGNANLFLVNPSGIVLGPTGSVNVGGSVSMSTADYLRFDGTSTLFDMLSTPASLGPLSVAPVVAFGFTGPEPPGSIEVQGSILQVQEGKSLSLVGGDITIQAANLHAPGGQINLVSVASSGEVLVPSFQTDSFTSMGTVMLKEGATLDVSGQLDDDGIPIGNGNSGTVLVRGGQLIMEASRIRAITSGAVNGASTAVDIQISQKAALTSGSSINTRTFGAGKGGGVQLTADTVTMEGNSRIFTGAFNDSGDGIAGDVVLSAREVSLMGGSLIESQSLSATPGLGHGNVTIQGLPEAESGAAESVTLSGGSSLVTTTFSSGDGGDVAITARSLKMEGPDTTINASTNAEGHGGDIVVRVQRASLLEGATIKTLTGSADLNAPAASTVTVQGLNGRMADSVALSGPGSGILSETTGGARSGHVTVESNAVSLRDGAVIQTGVIDFVGAAGDVTINAGSVNISGGSRISSRSSAGNAGQVAIKASTLTLDNVSIETSTTSSGLGGDVVLDVGSVSLTNGASINSQTFATGRAGDITITSGSLALANQSEITSSSLGAEATGDAGNITIQSGSTVQLNNSSITTEAEKASGGQIEINAPEMVRLTNSEVSTSVKGVTGESNGGNITIDPQFVILQNSQIIAQANAGAGGNISIIAGVFLADPNSVVDATSQRGISGEINIQSPVQNLGEQLTPLTQQFSSAAALLAQRCAARVADGKFSTFVVAGREGLPAEPGGFLASPSLTAELFSSGLSGLYPHIPIAALTGSIIEYDARPIQLAKYGDACR